jgi:hypothetical protein
MKIRSYVFTLNNYTPEEIEILKKLEVKYIGWAEEICPKTGTPHLQGFITFLNPIEYNGANKKMGGRVRLAEKSEFSTFKQARDYFAAPPSRKDQIVVGLFENGTLPMDPKEKGECPKIQYATAIALAKEGKFDEIDPILRTRYLRTYQLMYQRKKQKIELEDTEELHEWYWGEAGSGKSRAARALLGRCYKKRAATNWWDGYDGGDVLIEDFDKTHHYMAHDLKIWLDRYPFPAERKGSQYDIRPGKIIITSNCHPSEIWTDIIRDLNPILRRLKVTKFQLPL